MATSTLTDSKITHYFPPSPSRDDSKGTDSPRKISESITGCLENADLSNSSVVITPQSTPDKDQTRGNDDQMRDTDDQTRDNDDQTDNKQQGKTTKDPACKKTLTDKLDKVTDADPEPVQRPKSRRRGRRKKQTDAVKTDVTNTTTTNGPAKPKASRKKKTEGDGLKNSLLTDFFPVRRSDRKSKSDIQKEKDEELHTKILSGCEDGLKIEDIENKGRGVMATKKFLRGDFVVEYAGDLISIPEAKDRDTKYAKDPAKGCYMYYFQFKNKKYCIDATAETGKLGRLLNHSKSQGNCHTKLVDVKGQPYLILAASQNINEGDELLYDYGDRSKDSLESHPWLKL